MAQFPNASSHWVWPLVVLVAAPVVAVILHTLLAALATRLTRLTHTTIDKSIVDHARRPTRVIFPLAALLLVLPGLPLPPGAEDIVRHTLGVALIAATAWLLMALFSVVDDLVAERFPIDVADNLRARSVLTQIRVLRRVAIVIVTTITMAIILMTFPTIRHIGDSILASAGLAGLIIGLAARPTLTNLIAGVQLVLTEPIRIDDVVIVEGEWGRIEEIRTTYVVVRIWDLRRLVVPLSYFIEHPFQNWTRTSAEIVGSVFVFADYRVPVEELRQEVHRILQTTDLWDGRVWNVQVTDATEHAVQIRALMSSADSSKSWDLRCLVREQLATYLQTHHPESLPRVRAEVGVEDRRAAAARGVVAAAAA
jgi:small-conductance mechanosensitive channel